MRSPELWKRKLGAIHFKSHRERVRESSGASICTDCKLWYSPMVRDRGGKERATDGRSLSNSALTFSSDNTLQQNNHARTRSLRRCEQRSASIMDGASVCALRSSALTRCHVATREAVSGASGLVCLFSTRFPYGLSVTVMLGVTRGRHDFGERASRLRVERWHSKIQAKLSVFPCKETDTCLRDT